MKLKDLHSILCSNSREIQWAIVYDLKNNIDLEYNCSIDYAIKNYGEYEVIKINSCYENGRHSLVITI